MRINQTAHYIKISKLSIENGSIHFGLFIIRKTRSLSMGWSLTTSRFFIFIKLTFGDSGKMEKQCKSDFTQIEKAGSCNIKRFANQNGLIM
ncbi:hypothetical protein BV913_04230 [Neisseria dumasiana]|uniref:Uncharacterized protein n=1 Tax=Neisseria dumasiana TaxID=1931275 RepID=A0ABX3WM35_9NEIS|nr:hypothetical protein BV913_04230 [Neisseria dumasiana]